jgi:IS5 family transposase
MLSMPRKSNASAKAARQPDEFGVKVGLAVIHPRCLMVDARTFPGHPYDGHLLKQQFEQAAILLEDTGMAPQQVFVDLGFLGGDGDNPHVQILQCGQYKSLTKPQHRWLKRRAAVEPAIGHLKSDHRMNRCWLKGVLGDARHAVLCAVGYNLCWFLRAMVRLGLKAVFLCWLGLTWITFLSRLRFATAQKTQIFIR